MLRKRFDFDIVPSIILFYFLMLLAVTSIHDSVTSHYKLLHINPLLTYTSTIKTLLFPWVTLKSTWESRGTEALYGILEDYSRTRLCQQRHLFRELRFQNKYRICTCNVNAIISYVFSFYILKYLRTEVVRMQFVFSSYFIVGTVQ